MNRSCYNVAESFLYRGLRISITTRANLYGDVAELRKSDAGKKYLQHARQLELTGWMVPLDSENGETLSRLNHKRLGSVDPSFTLPELLKPDFPSVFGSDGMNNKLEDDLEVWKPLVLVICEFRNLSDLIYTCSSRFPPGLLDAIHRHHPTCRLHLRFFRFKSLNDAVTDPDEHALVTSPCLHSLSVLYTWRDSQGIDDHNEDAAIRTVALAPNLKHVRMLGCRPASSAALHMSRSRPKESWNGFVPPIDTFNRSSLISLSFCGYYRELTKVKFDEWHKYTDFSKLQEMAFSVSDSNVLMDVVVESPLPCLKHLSIGLRRHKNDEDFKLAAEAFFDTLRPLNVLSVAGTLHTELLAKICDRHGSALRELALTPYEGLYDMAGPPLLIAAADISMIGSSCPHLSNLDITIRRSMSNRSETKCYEALGTIRTLKKLHVRLDCTNPTNLGPPSDNWDEFNKTLSGLSMPRVHHGHLEYAIVNSAVDETLARSIWDVISENTHKPPLESLEITSCGGSGFGNSHPGDLMTIVRNLSRSYLITVSASSDGDKLKVVEMTKESREKSDELQRKLEEVMLEKWGHRGLNGPSFTVFNRLWPLEEGNKNWREAWCSWPLQRSKRSQ